MTDAETLTRDLVALSQEWDTAPHTGMLVFLIQIMSAVIGGCLEARESMTWAIQEGYIERLPGAPKDDPHGCRVTDYGEWAACVWVRMTSGYDPY